MQLKFLYTLVLIFFVSIYASSNECSRPVRIPTPARAGSEKAKEAAGAGEGASAHRADASGTEESPVPHGFLITNFLYI